MFALAIFSAVLGTIFTFVVIRFAQSNGADYPANAPQRFHMRRTPRLGGIGISLACALAWCVPLALPHHAESLGLAFHARSVTAWIAVCGLAFLAGLLDDLSQRFGVRGRLALTVLAGVLACVLLKVHIPRLGISALDTLLTEWSWVGWILAVIAVGGLPHAMNIIDGYNGLAAVVTLIILGALIYLSLLLGDRHLAGMLTCAAGATLGFLIWNYPRGLVFAGDSGAYFWGTVIALGCILLVQRHPQVSPWAVMLLLIYPVWETLFSIYRKLQRGVSPSMADSLHFHQLIYKRLVRGAFHDDLTRQTLIRNNRTSPYLWAFSALSVIPAALFWNSTPILMFFCGLFVVTYVAAYIMLVRFKTPKWLTQRRTPPK